MGNDILLHVNPSPLNFSGISRPLSESNFVFLGIPFDGTVSYKPGCRFGPSNIRELSMNIETYSLRTGIDLEDIAIHDLGDLNVVPGNVTETLRRVELVAKELAVSGRIPLVAGGEHTLTLPVIRGLSDVSVLHFDAHGDLRDEYLGESICHATVMRRVCELIKPENVLQVGIRALSKTEVEYSTQAGVGQITSYEILEGGLESAIAKTKRWLSKVRRLYVTVDLDVFDPAFAPGVGNPEAEGLAPSDVLRILSSVVDNRIVGLDVVELAPIYDKGQTASLAAKIFFEFCCLAVKQGAAKLKGPS